MDAVNIAVANGIEIKSQRYMLSISADDCCSTCAELLYAPRDRSLCNCEGGPMEDWPCKFEGGYSVSCGEFKEFKPGQTNCVEDLKS